MNTTAPSGVVTFLFTDIEGSTRRWEADPDGMRVALAAHDEVLREAVQAHGGWLFKHTGDGVCAAFSSPRAAVDAAIAAQRALDLPVRMGIATGEAELRGDDYFGAALNRTARLMAAGHGGQVLLDGVTAGLVSGVSLIALGARRLRDIAKPVDVFQVTAEGLRTEFPALKTADPAQGNLRARTTSFVGRELELADLTEALKAHRLLTLTGVGGVGKTRLALELAARVATGFPDGVWVVELASVVDPHAVPDAVAAVLGITQQSNCSLTESISVALEGRTRLLVLDNCEHVLDAAADLIEALITHTPVTVIATSREGLRLADEQLWPVPSLDVGTAAVDLFIDRVRGVAPSVEVTDHGPVRDICQRLDGIPLAIELAASRMQSMTPAEVRDRLDDRFRLLVGSRRGLERHQTLRHAVQWSYDLLNADEKHVLTSCSVFSGGFDLGSACAICGSDDDLATLDVLDSLVRKSLLVADRSATRTRYSMLETIRQFAEDKLFDAGDAEKIRHAHAKYFAAKETVLWASWHSPQQRQAYEWFTRETANLRSAFRWAADTGDFDSAIAISFYAGYLGTCINQLEPITWAEQMIEPAERIQHPRLAQLYIVAVQCYLFGRIDDAKRYSEVGQQAVMSGRFEDDPTNTEATLGAAYIRSGESDRWVDWCHTLLTERSNTDIFTRSCLTHALTIGGRLDEAVAASRDLPDDADTKDNPNIRIQAMLAYGFANADANPLKAYDVLQRAFALAQESGNTGTRTHVTVILSRLAATHGDPNDALVYFTLAIRSFFDAGSFSLLPSPLSTLVAFLDRLGSYEPAAIISRFATNSLTRTAFPELNTAIEHLRATLGEERYGALAAEGASMTNAEMANYAFEQIDLACAQVTSP